jgi:threonine dehydrogenase-like Zn-dependent dehydrogenase
VQPGRAGAIALRAEYTIAIFGQRPVGLSATQLASEMGAHVIALDPSEERLARAIQFGADIAVDPAPQGNVVEAIATCARARCKFVARWLLVAPGAHTGHVLRGT